MPADRPLLLYLCSSPFITPYEVGFVRAWIEAIRRVVRIPQLRRAAHPDPSASAERRSSGRTSIRRRYEAVGIWPRAGANPGRHATRGPTTTTRCSTASRWSASTPAR